MDSNNNHHSRPDGHECLNLRPVQWNVKSAKDWIESILHFPKYMADSKTRFEDYQLKNNNK